MHGRTRNELSRSNEPEQLARVKTSGPITRINESRIAMLSIDELKNGVPFILKFADADGTARQWVESLRGPAAEHWYHIYRDSDWRTLREEYTAVFQHPVTPDEAEQVRRSRRCVVINADVFVMEHARPHSSAEQATQ
jgi:hypothetical protein